MVIQTITVSNCQPQTIVIGRRGTYDTLQIAFDLSYLVENYGSGTAVLAVKRSQDTSAYPAVVSQADNILTWMISDVDTYYVGSGECQLMWYVEGGLAKTIIYPMVVMRDILTTSEEAPDAYQTWVDDLTALGAETLQNAQNAAQSASDAESAKDDAVTAKEAAEEAAETAQEAVVHAPIIQNGYWYIWNDGQYVDTGVRAEGQKGDKGDTGEKGDTGNGIASITKTGTAGLVDTYTVTYTDGTTTTFTVTNGAKGDKGDTGATGNGIASITKTGTSGNVDTYTITYTNGQTTTFTVTNGAVSSVAGKTGAVTLDANDVAFSESGTYDDGTVGKELSDQKNAIDQKQNAPSSAGTAGQVLGLNNSLQPVWVNQSGGGDVSNCAPIIINTASGDIASFADGADNRQIRKIVGTIVPVQSGTGDPSPDNVRPISGWTGANITGTGVNILDIRYGKALPYTDNGITFTEVANGGVQISGTATSNVFWNTSFNGSVGQPCDKFRGQHIYFSYGNAIQGVNVKTGYINTAGAIITFNNGNVLGNDAKYFRFYIQIASGSNFTTPVTIYPQIEIGTARTVFEPFGTTLPINWQSSAGTIYSGTVTLNEDGSADVVATGILDRLNPTASESIWQGSSGGRLTFLLSGTMTSYLDSLCNQLAFTTDASTVGNDANLSNYILSNTSDGNTRILLHIKDVTDKASTLQYLQNNNVMLYRGLNSVVNTYHIPNAGQLYTYLGTNNVWIDTGAITECDYPADTKLYIDGLTAPDEDMIADGLIASGKYFTVNNQLYLSTTQIAAGAQIIPGSNCIATNIVEALNALNT